MIENNDPERGALLGEALGILPIRKHEYLREEEYYESQSVGKGRKHKTCEHCGGSIPVGMSHTVHKFYGDGDWPSYPTHNECVKDFKKSLN